MSKVERSKCSGEWPELRSDEWMPKYGVAQSRKLSTFSWVITTPFGTPVEPDVNRICAASDAEVSSAIGSDEKAARSLGQKSQAISCVSARATPIEPVFIGRFFLASLTVGWAGSDTSRQQDSHDCRIFAIRGAGLAVSSGK